MTGADPKNLRRPTPSEAEKRIEEVFEEESTALYAEFVSPPKDEKPQPESTINLTESQLNSIFVSKEKAFLAQIEQLTRHTGEIHELRKQYVPKLFQMIVGWLIFVGLITFLISVSVLSLSDTVMIALITTTTATVLGVFVIVAKWLFPANSK